MPLLQAAGMRSHLEKSYTTGEGSLAGCLHRVQGSAAQPGYFLAFLVSCQLCERGSLAFFFRFQVHAFMRNNVLKVSKPTQNNTHLCISLVLACLPHA